MSSQDQFLCTLDPFTCLLQFFFLTFRQCLSKGHLYPSHTSMGHCIIQNTPSICSLIWLPPFTSTVLVCKELPGEGRGFYKYRVPSLFSPLPVNGLAFVNSHCKILMQVWGRYHCERLLIHDSFTESTVFKDPYNLLIAKISNTYL